MPAPVQTCGNCFFALVHETDNGYFYCRRYPPQISKADSFVKDGNCKSRIGRNDVKVSINSHVAQFPVMISSDWCGEWKQ